MICECGGKVKTVETRHKENETYRKKQCVKCNRVFFTVEYEVEYTMGYLNDLREARRAAYKR